MTIPFLEALWAFVTNVSFGLPFLVLSAGLLAWLLWEPAAPLYRSATRETFRPAEGDSVSRSFFAVRARQYSRLVLEAQWRLDAVLRRRYRLELRSLPRRAWMGVDRPLVQELRRRRRRLVSTYLSARRHEPIAGRELPTTGWRARSRDRFEERLERFLRDMERFAGELEVGR